MNSPRTQAQPTAHVMRFIALIVFVMSLGACASTQKTGKHLFILSGQSNMTGTVKGAFTQRVHERYGEENAVVVMSMRSGRGIRFWVEDYRQPGDRGLVPKKMNSNGEEYTRLIKAVMDTAKDESFDTVGFIWMQGESDANNRLSEVYEASFHKLIARLEKDLGRDDVYYVIGRINDYAKSRPDNEHWQRVRQAQVSLGSTKGNAWIDTDDLNGGTAEQPDGDIHFPREGAGKLGQRFAESAIGLIDNQ